MSRIGKTDIFGKQPDSTIDFKRYLNLLWDKKYIIILITIVISIFWFFIFKFFLNKGFDLTSTAIIRFDTPQSMRVLGTVSEYGNLDAEARLTTLRTTSFLSRVVDSLHLDLVLETPGISKNQFFTEIRISDSAQVGNYRIEKKDNEIKVFYSFKDEVKNIRNKLVFTGTFSTNNLFTINCQGLQLVINTDFLHPIENIEFSFIPKRAAISNLRGRLTYNLDRSRTILTLSYTDRDPELVAQVTNTVARLFIEELLQFKKYRTTSIIKSLNEQLIAAQQQLEQSESALRQFRERNPYLMLSGAGSTIVNQLTTSETELLNVDQSISRIMAFMEERNKPEISQKNLIYQEILAFLQSQNFSGSQVLNERFNNLINQRNQLLTQNFPETSPVVRNVDEEISSLRKDIDSRLNQLLNTLQNQKSSLQEIQVENQQNLRRLPGNELRLAELERDREVKSNIYSSILVRYNEAKIADASIVPDAYLIEEASIPVGYVDIFQKLKILIIGPFLGLILGVGIFILQDFLNYTIKDEKDIEKKLNLTVLATLPVIGSDKEIPDQLDLTKKLDPKLITSDYAPHVAGESFRLLRTKLLMQNKNDNKGFIIASLNPGEGKSLVASNLAITFAQQKIPTLLLDCDLRRGVLHNTFDCPKKPGLSDLLVSGNPITIENVSSIIQKTHVPNLFFLSNGTQIPNPSEILGSLRMKSLYQLMSREFGALIFDSPPLEFIPDALVLNNFVHNIILVVRYGKTNLNRMQRKLIEYSNILEKDLAGVVINASSQIIEKKYSSYSYYHY